MVEHGEGEDQPMRIVALSDLHGRVSALARLAEVLATADLVLLAGDLTHFGGRAQAQEVLQALGQYTAQVLAVPGNCDPPAVQQYLVEQGVSLHGTCQVIDGLAFLGVGGSLPCPGRTPNELGEAQFAEVLARALRDAPPGAPLLLLAHQPPAQTKVDRAFAGRHVGSKALRAFIETNQPLACFCGHIHEARGTDRIGATWIVNPGPARDGRCAIAEIEHGDCRVTLYG